MEKYMGNKSKICKNILDATIAALKPGAPGKVFDPFSGTTNVSRYFKNHRFDIVCNDINDLSFVLAQCYLKCCKIPTFDTLFRDNAFLARLNQAKSDGQFASNTEAFISDNKNTASTVYISRIQDSNFLKLLVYLTYYATEQDWAESYKPYFLIRKNYCEQGSNAKYLNQVHKKTLIKLQKEFRQGDEAYALIDRFLSYPFSTEHLEVLSALLEKKDNLQAKHSVDALMNKNLVGERRFFSPEHGERLDIILNLITYWYRRSLLQDSEFYVLLASVLESVSIFSNTSATYQAFYKEYKANTLQRFRLVIPVIDETKVAVEIHQEDVCTLIPKIDADVLYLDPPYNWRQYDSNYHLLNTIARFHKIGDWADFEKGIVGASGENREKKLQYTSFNQKKNFEQLLFGIIQDSKCRTVVLSYSDSKSNHDREETDELLDKINDFFQDSQRFEYFRMYQIQSVNFESRKGNKKNDVNELLFVARKRETV